MSEKQAKTQIWISTFCIVVLASFWTPLWRNISHEWFDVLEMIEIGHLEEGWRRMEYPYFPQVFDHLMVIFGWVLLILVGASWRLVPFCPEGTQRQLAQIRAGMATLFIIGLTLSLIFRVAPVVQEVDLTERASAACVKELEEIEAIKQRYLKKGGGAVTNLNVLSDQLSVSQIERCLLPHGYRSAGDLTQKASCTHAEEGTVWRHTLFEYYTTGTGHKLPESPLD